MRRLSPSYVVTSVAIALASTAALAQLRVQAAPGTNATASTTAGGTVPQGTTSSGPAVTVGGCTGTGGSTCTATTTNANANATGTATPGASGSATPATTSGTVTTPGTGSTTTDAGGSSNATTSRPFTPDFVNNAAADAPFRTTPNTPDAMPTGAALGRSPGQTSSGTAAGNSSGGIEAGSQNLGTENPSGTNLGNTALVPGVTVGATTGFAGATGGVTAGGERIGNGAGAAANNATTPTPIFELTARQGAAREARRRARGEEPRVYGIAPRTDRDLTRQMPDDPIIRY